MHLFVIYVFGNINFELQKCTFPNLHSLAMYKHCIMSDSVDVHYSICHQVSVSLNFILFLKQCNFFLLSFYAFL